MARNISSGVAVVGLGRFGTSLALELVDEGVEVLGIDSDPKVVASLAGRLTHLVEADSTDLEAMRELGVADFSRAVIGIGTNVQASILSASVLLELEVPHVWAKAISAAHARILGQIGAHHVVRPEHDTGKRVAHLVTGRMIEYIEFDDGYAFAKTRPPRDLLDRPLGSTRVRAEYGITVVGVKARGEEFTYATPETVLREGSEIVVSGAKDDVDRFSSRR